MTQAIKRHGRCLCGGVTFDVTLKNLDADVCHCSMCRAWGAGGPGIFIYCDNDVAFQNADTIRWYQSSEWAQRGFCNACGAGLFYKFQSGDEAVMNVAVGCLADDSGITIEKHIFIDNKPPYYDFTDECPRLTEAQTWAEFQKEHV